MSVNYLSCYQNCYNEFWWFCLSHLFITLYCVHCTRSPCFFLAGSSGDSSLRRSKQMTTSMVNLSGNSNSNFVNSLRKHPDFGMLWNKNKIINYREANPFVLLCCLARMLNFCFGCKIFFYVEFTVKALSTGRKSK